MPSCGGHDRAAPAGPGGASRERQPAGFRQLVVPACQDYRYRAVFGAWAEEVQLQRGRLPVGELAFTSRQGITGHHANPWIMIDAGDAGEEHGEVWASPWPGAEAGG